MLGCLNSALDHFKVVGLRPFHKIQDELKAVVDVDQLKAAVGIDQLKAIGVRMLESWL